MKDDDRNRFAFRVDPKNYKDRRFLLLLDMERRRREREVELANEEIQRRMKL